MLTVLYLTVKAVMAAERFFWGTVDRKHGQTKKYPSDTWPFRGLRVSPGRFVWLCNPSSLRDLFIYIPNKSLYLGCINLGISTCIVAFIIIIPYLHVGGRHRGAKECTLWTSGAHTLSHKKETGCRCRDIATISVMWFRVMFFSLRNWYVIHLCLFLSCRLTLN